MMSSVSLARVFSLLLLSLLTSIHFGNLQTPQLSSSQTGYQHDLSFRLTAGEPLPGADHPWPTNRSVVPTQIAAAAPPQGVDLDVTYISRTPMYHAYCVIYPDGVPGIPQLCPGTESQQRWPAPGELVTFTAHIINKGTVASAAFNYAWYVDGVEVHSGVLPELAPGAETTTAFQWAWAHTMDGERVLDDHRIRFTADPANTVVETYESNNTLEDRTNALSFRIAITPAMYEAYNTPVDPALPYSTEDWLQKQIAAMNASLANSVYDVAPVGTGERVRINAIEIVASPPLDDRTNDGGWFIDSDYRVTSGFYDPATDIDWGFVHELSHQIGLIDLYTLNIGPDNVQVRDRNGQLVNFGFTWPRPDLMFGGDIAPHTDPNLYSSHSAGGLFSSKGYRRGYFGEYQFDIPAKNYLLVLDSGGNPVEGVEVALYQRLGPPDWVGSLALDDQPEMTGVTGTDGRFLLTNRPSNGGTTTRTAHTLRDNPFGLVDIVGNWNRFLVRLATTDHEEFHWLDITAFNLAYWRGNTESHTFVVNSHIPPPGAPAAPELSTVRVTGNTATLCWEPLTGAHVNLYRAAAPTYEYTLAAGSITDSCVTDSYSANRVYALTTADQGRESSFSSFAWAPFLVNPKAVAILADGSRVILDPQAEPDLLSQSSTGNYLQQLGSVHFHLEKSQFLAVDRSNQLLISHPGDDFSARHSVRIADMQGTPLTEFGEFGAAPGQFDTPVGVAAWGEACTVEGVHDVDAATMLLLHFDNSYNGAQGETGSANGTAFQSGKYDQGVFVDGSDTLTYPSAGNFNRTEGSIEFWLQPNWPGNDGQNYTLFEIGDEWFNRMRIAKDGANNLRFLVWDSSQEYGLHTDVSRWLPGEWHHIAATWTDNTIVLYVDGVEKHRAPANPPARLAATIYVGSSLWQNEQANATVDELRISNISRVGNSETCGRILVADSGNLRLQAFDNLGNFLSSFGSLGSGNGQFNSPQGVAVDSNGRVIVADRGNNRLQVLSFDGQNFAFLQAITANFNGPTAVAVTRDDRIIVADTGNNKIKVLGSDGALLEEYTGPDDGYGGTFNAPGGVAVDLDDIVVVADTGNARVVTISLTPSPSTVVANDDAGTGFTTDEDKAFTTGNVLANDTSVSGSSLSVVSIDTATTRGVVTDNGDGTFHYDPDGQFEHLRKRQSVTDTFSYTITDSSGATDTATVAILVQGVNDAPVLSNLRVTSPVPAGSAATLSGNMTDVDGPGSFTLKVNWGDGRTDTYTYAAHTERFSEQYVYKAPGRYNIMITLSDEGRAKDKESLKVTVTKMVPEPMNPTLFLPTVRKFGL